MDPLDAVSTRCTEAGLDGEERDPKATIRISGRWPTNAPTLASARSPIETTSRELPRISVELRGTLSGKRGDAEVASTDDRDLEVLRTLGEGGMGRVFLARQHSLDRDVAIKTVRDTSSEKERAALLAEGAIVGYLEHPSVIPVHALGVDADGRPVLVMKCVEGAAWADLLADPDHPAWKHRGGDASNRLDGHLEILMQVCNAAHFAHSRGIIHRDIKPHNVLIGLYGEVYLADWGIALRIDHVKGAMPLCGTPAYMAPEMVAGGTIDERTDVYLLGATLHELLMGKPRHTATNFRATLASAALSAAVAYPSSVPAALAALANAATSIDPAKRPASAADVRQAIADYQRHKSSFALAASAVERVASLRALIADGAALANEARQHEIDVLGAETRFALDQALREWSDNPEAKRAAAELDVLLASRRARAAELERLARELDPSVASRQRAVAVGALAVVGLALSISAFVGDGRDVTLKTLLLQSLAPVAIVSVTAVILRHQLFRTALNRRAVLGSLAAVVAVTANRALGLVAGASTAHVLVYDCLLLATLSFTYSTIMFRWAAWGGVILGAGATWAAMSPSDAMRAFSAATGAALLVNAWFAWRAGRASKS